MEQEQEPTALQEEREVDRGDGLTGDQPGDGREGRGPAVQGAPGAKGDALDVAEITSKPEARIGERITVNGKIDEILGERGLRLTGMQGGGQDLLVLGRPSVERLSDDWDDKTVSVTGTLRRMSSATELERELGWNLDSDLEQSLSEERVVLIANSIQPMAGAEGTTQGAEERRENAQERREKQQGIKQDIREEKQDVREEQKDVQEKQRELQQQQRPGTTP